MGHSRSNYQMPAYGDNRQIHPMMHHHQQSQNNMYASGGYMNQMGGNYGMGSYGYGMANAQPNLNSPPSMMMRGPRGNAMPPGGYYNHHMNQQNSVQSANAAYGPRGVGGSPMHCQGQMNHMPPTAAALNQNHPQVSAAQHASSPHGMPAQQSHPNSSVQGQGHQETTVTTSPTATMTGRQAESRTPTAAARSGSGSHQIPHHPMRLQTAPQNPQEVADNILQIASSYPSNQTVSYMNIGVFYFILLLLSLYCYNCYFFNIIIFTDLPMSFS